MESFAATLAGAMQQTLCLLGMYLALCLDSLLFPMLFLTWLSQPFADVFSILHIPAADHEHIGNLAGQPSHSKNPCFGFAWWGYSFPLSFHWLYENRRSSLCMATNCKPFYIVCQLLLPRMQEPSALKTHLFAGLKNEIKTCGECCDNNRNSWARKRKNTPPFRLRANLQYINCS